MAASKIEIKKGDVVEIICGGGGKGVKTKGKQGKVQVVYPGENKVILENLNMVKKHKKPRSAQQAGGIIEMPRAVDASNVMVVCPECGKKTRIGHTLAADGKKYVRQCKKCSALLDRKESKVAAKAKKAKAADKKVAEKKAKAATEEKE